MAYRVQIDEEIYKDDTGTGSGSTSIPQYDTDPASPTAEDAWVLRSGSAGSGGKLKYLHGLGTPITAAGTGGYTYQFSYYTNEGTIIRASMS